MEEPKQKHTDQKLLIKGLKYLAFTLVLFILGPYLITLSFINNNTLFILVPGIIAAIGAIYCGFKGINTIMKAIF